MQLIFSSALDDVKPDINRLNTQIVLEERRRAPPSIPRRGEWIEFLFQKQGKPYVFVLEVAGITYNYAANQSVVELHIPMYDKRSVADWSAWFKEFRYG